ncbi:MAG: thrombospondin type-1 domain-containing protein [Halobacteriovoraceae bacterium]|nr:thrombospondin type-1 domain-containing protein [Halobacteriovoraceae bacterium]
MLRIFTIILFTSFLTSSCVPGGGSGTGKIKKSKSSIKNLDGTFLENEDNSGNFNQNSETYSWEIQSIYGECSNKCGSGIKTKIVHCKSSFGAIVGDQFCTSLGNKPIDSSSCHDESECGPNGSGNSQIETHWVETDWGDCSATCGHSGLKTKTVYCASVAGVPLDDGKCDIDIKPPTEMTCSGACDGQGSGSTSSGSNGQVGVGYTWFKGPYGSCEGPCGINRGTQTRVVYCNSLNNQATSDNYCRSITRPSSTQSCTIQCEDNGGGNGGDDNGDGTGSDGGDNLESYTCTGTKPSNTVASTIDSGPIDANYSWVFADPLTSRPCEFQCVQGKIWDPINSSCINPPIAYEWNIFLDWNACTEQCGGGVQTRTFKCYESGTNNRVDDSLCAGIEMPSNQRTCNTQTCPIDPPLTKRHCWNAGSPAKIIETTADGEYIRDLEICPIHENGGIMCIDDRSGDNGTCCKDGEAAINGFCVTRQGVGGPCYATNGCQQGLECKNLSYDWNASRTCQPK